MTPEAIQSLAADDMNAVDTLIRQRLHSEVALINQLSEYIIYSGGKRLRPLLAVLCARACGYEGNQHVDAATIVELIHTATLLHDDVVDDSSMRRGKETANELFGNEAAVLVGDFLYSRSFEMMVSIGSMRVMEILSHTTNVIAEGEVLQLLNCNDPDTTEARYIDVIHSKTAKLFEAACQIGAVLAAQPAQIEGAMARYGMHLGSAFQLIDDVLDYSSDADTLGKNVGDDLAEGKPTLPLIHAMREGSEGQRQMIRQAIKEGGLDHLDEILDAIKTTGALDYTEALAKRESSMAIAQLSCLPDGEHRQALEGLATYAINRYY